MATKQTKKKKKTSKKTPLLAKNRFNLPTLIALVGVLSMVGYYVLTTFAAGPARLSPNCPASVSNDTGYACYRDSAEGWAARLFMTMYDRSPDGTKTAAGVATGGGYKYWSEQISAKGVGASAVSMYTVAGTTDKARFNNYTPEQKAQVLYTRALGRNADAAGIAYWKQRFASEPAGNVVVAFLSQNEPKTFNKTLSVKVLNFMRPGWNTTTTQPPVVVNPPQPPEEPEEPEEPAYNPAPEQPQYGGVDNPDYSFVIPDDGSIGGGTDALPELGEVSLDDLSGASEDDISKIIEEKTQSSGDGLDSEAAARSYGGKLKILPPEEAIANGANELRYYINGKLKATVKKAPYAYTLDSTRMKNGRYVLSIVPYQDGEKLDEYSYVLSVKNTLTFWQKIYNLISSPFAK
jgi:hypothetical protein